MEWLIFVGSLGVGVGFFGGVLANELSQAIMDKEKKLKDQG